MKHGGLPTEDDYGGYIGQVSTSYITTSIVKGRRKDLKLIIVSKITEKLMSPYMFFHRMVIVI